MARKLPGLQRVLETPSLAAVAYGEIASSLFFALGVVALQALGFTPWVLLLDYLIVIALAGLFVPHYFGQAVGWDALTDSPADIFVGIGAIVTIAAVRFLRRPRSEEHTSELRSRGQRVC